MRRLIVLGLSALLLLSTGCASLTGESVATRVLAGLQCVAAITAAGGQVATDPDLGFATAADAFAAIGKLASGPALSNAITACRETFKYLGEDVAGATTLLEAKATSPEPPAQRRARMRSAVTPAQQGPVVVKIPLK